MLKEEQGFTLVEIMVVIAIIAALVAITVPGILRSRMVANEVAAQATLKTLGTACEAYATDHSATYPTTMADLTDTTPPYFFRNIVTGDIIQSYTYTVLFPANGYTFTAQRRSNTGNWDYQISTGLILKRSEPGKNDWRLF